MSFVVPPEARSWVEVTPDSDFPIQNLPFGQVRNESESGIVVAIGDYMLDLDLLAQEGLLPSTSAELYDLHSLIESIGPEGLSELRRQVFELLVSSNGVLRDNSDLQERALLPVGSRPLDLPLEPSAFVDFYSGIHHASNVGKMFRPDQPPLLPNYRHVPVGYNGRASSVVPTGTDVRRPNGQQKVGEDVIFGPTKELDFELEVGFFTGKGNKMGKPIPIGEAADYIAGFVLVNDWSARDVQRWEYQPLGPFLAKSFATSVSPWLVLPDALEPFKLEGMSQDPEPLPHLRGSSSSAYDVTLEVAIQSQRMSQPQVICRSNMKHLYWSFVQQLTHQASNGTPLQVGDLYASGTISGPDEGTFGSMLELSWKGTKPILLAETGEERTFLEDGDTVIMRGYAQGNGYRVGFGEVRSAILPAGD